MNWRLALIAAIPPACVAWGVVEAKLYRVSAYVLHVLPEGAEPISVLQISDTHLRMNNTKLQQFVRSLSDRTFDIVLATGDLLGEPAAVDPCAEILNGLNARIGKFFVLGSSDYFAPVFKNYLDYFLGRKRHGTRRNPTPRFKELLTTKGWTDLTNRTTIVEGPGMTIQLSGMDDPHLGWDDRSILVRDPKANFAMCVVHDPAPYLDAERAGFDLTTSGHTHGGQVRFPFVGALVTNTSVPRRFAKGKSEHGQMTLFITPGLGTGKFAPFRFMCPPEASVLRLLPKVP